MTRSSDTITSESSEWLEFHLAAQFPRGPVMFHLRFKPHYLLPKMLRTWYSKTPFVPHGLDLNPAKNLMLNYYSSLIIRIEIQDSFIDVRGSQGLCYNIKCHSCQSFLLLTSSSASSSVTFRNTAAFCLPRII